MSSIIRLFCILILSLGLSQAHAKTKTKARAGKIAVGVKVVATGKFRHYDVGVLRAPMADGGGGKKCDVNMEMDKVLCDIEGLGACNRDQLTGVATLISSMNSCDRITKKNTKPGGGEPDDPSTFDACEGARKLWKKHHKGNGKKFSDWYGQIVSYDMVEFTATSPDKDYLKGIVRLCSWIADHEYYFVIHLKKATIHQRDVAATNDGKFPFPDTLDLSDLDPVAKAELINMLNAETSPGSGQYKFDYKLHAQKNDMEILIVRKNGTVMPAGSGIYNTANECFDMFFKTKPGTDLPAASGTDIGYCLGRCDAKILNTM